MASIAFLECTKCGAQYSAATPQTICSKDGGILYARYDLGALRATFNKESLKGRVASMWRYAEVLPDAPPVTLGEGLTPMLTSREFPHVFIKDEGLNTTASFKARGMSAAGTRAK